MKSGKQRRAEIKQNRAGKKAAIAAAGLRASAALEAKARARRLRGQVLVNPASLQSTNSYSTPDFVLREFYVDRSFSCKDCAKPQVWTATQQKWWYEVARGDVWTVAIRCKPCRRRERERVEQARRVRQVGMVKKRARLR